MASNYIKNVLFVFIGRVIQLAFGMLISIAIARTLGPEKQGIYSMAILLPAILLIFLNFGISSANIFYIGGKKYSLMEIFSANIVCSIVISIFAILLGLTIIYFFSDKLFYGISQEYLLLSLISVPFQLFFGFALAILNGMKDFKKSNILQVFQSFIYFILIVVLFLFFGLGIKEIIISQTIAIVIVCMIIFTQIKNRIVNFTLSFNNKILLGLFSYGSKDCLVNISSFLHYRIDIFMLNYFLNPLSVGFYFIATSIIEKLWIISDSASIVLFSEVSSETNKERIKKSTPLVCRNIIFINLIVAILFYIISNWIIIFLYSERFLNSVIPFQILLIGLVTISGWRVLANDLCGRGKPLLNTYITVASIILNVILNIILIPEHGIVGAAWATSISYSFALIVVLVVYSKISENKIVDIVLIKKSDFIFYSRILYFVKNL